MWANGKYEIGASIAILSGEEIVRISFHKAVQFFCYFSCDFSMVVLGGGLCFVFFKAVILINSSSFLRTE